MHQQVFRKSQAQKLCTTELSCSWCSQIQNIVWHNVTVDPGSKPDQNLCLAEKHAKLHVKEFACVLNSGTLLECELILIFMTVYRAKGASLLLARVIWYRRVIGNSSFNALLACISIKLLNLRCGGCEAKTGSVWDFWAGTRVCKSKGNSDYNKEV